MYCNANSKMTSLKTYNITSLNDTFNDSYFQNEKKIEFLAFGIEFLADNHTVRYSLGL